MKVNLNRNLLDFRGREFIELVNGKESKKSVRDLVAEALFAAGSNPQKNMETSKKLRAYKMLQQIISNRGVLKVGSINSIFYFLHKAAEPFNCLEQDNLA